MQVAANVENWHGKFNIGGGGRVERKGKKFHDRTRRKKLHAKRL